MSYRKSFLLGVSFAALSTSAWAQQNSSAGQGGVETVTVTARAVQENMQDTPVAVTALSASQLENAGVTGTEGLSAMAPSLQISASGPNLGVGSAAVVFIRGIGQLDEKPGVDPGVGMYIDGVYTGSTVGGIMDFQDIANVQVLRGPQGTLFGRNTIGGAIVLTTTDPGDSYSADVHIGAGTDNLRNVQLAVDVPLSDTFRTRFTFGGRNQDGYVRNITTGQNLGSVDTYTVTGKAVWDITPSLKALFKADYTENRSNGEPLVLGRVNTSAQFVIKSSADAGCPGVTPSSTSVPNINDPRCLNNFYVLGPHETASGSLTGSMTHDWGAQANLEYAVTDYLTLKSITAYRGLQYWGRRDADNTPLLDSASYASGTLSQESEELQAVVNTGPLTMVSGLYAFHMRTNFIFEPTLNPIFLQSPPAPSKTPTPSTGETFEASGIYDNSNWAAFSQATYKIFDNLQLTGGLRYTEEDKRFLPTQYLHGYQSQPFVPAQWFSTKSSALTGTGALQYRLTDEVMAYASWTRGYKAGGWNESYTNAFLPAPTSFKPEYAESTEIGAKLDPTSDLRVNIALFRTDYRDMQLQYKIGIVPTNINAGSSTIRGAEVEFEWAPTPSLLISGNGSMLQDHINALVTVPGATTGVTTASKLPFIPKAQGQVSAQYSFPLPHNLEGSLRAAAIYTGRQFFDISDTVSQPTNVTTFDLGFSVKDPSSEWTARFAVKDVADKVYPITGNPNFGSGNGWDEVGYNRGREFMITLDKDF